ncbi:hypothetical protein [Yoonia sp.]|uniref:hypothetical protein n=1 Tax=Yoonia sp. TaxID=2212373 RepID=UPI0023B6809E
MSDLTALAQKLQAFVGTDDVFEDGARVISDLGAPSPLFAMLCEIDETILERALVFSSGQTSVQLVAAGRRLRGFTSVSGRGTFDEAIIGKTISREEPETLDMALALLSGVFDAADRVTVRSLPPEPFEGSGERGVPAADLMDIWDVAADDASVDMTGTPIERFLKTNAAGISAMLHIRAGEVVNSEGEVTALEKIWEDQANDFLEAEAALSEQSDAQKLISLDSVMTDDTGVTLIVSDNDVALLAHDPALLGKLHRTWQAIFR